MMSLREGMRHIPVRPKLYVTRPEGMCICLAAENRGRLAARAKAVAPHSGSPWQAPFVPGLSAHGCIRAPPRTDRGPGGTSSGNYFFVVAHTARLRLLRAPLCQILYYQGINFCSPNHNFFTTGARLFSKSQFLYYRCQAALEITISLLLVPGCSRNHNSFTIGATLFSKSQFLYYRCQAVLEIAISLLQVPGCSQNHNFFTTGSRLFSKSQFLYYRCQAALEITISLLLVPRCSRNHNFFTTGARLLLKSQFLYYRYQAVLEITISLLQVPGCSRIHNFFITGATLFSKS